MAKKDLVIVANASKQPLYKMNCNSCGNNIVATRQVIASCPYCGEVFENEGAKVKAASITASLSDANGFGVTCEDCSAHLSVYNSPKDAVGFSLSSFCPVCGGSNLTAADESTPQQPSAGTDDSQQFSDSACNDATCDQVSATDEQETEEQPVAVDQDILQAKKKAVEDTQKDVQDVLDSAGTGEDINPENLQWKAVNDSTNGQNGTLVAFSASTGNPLFIFRKSDCSADLQSIFATSLMTDAFTQVARKDGIGTAVSKFGGKAYPVKEVMRSNYLDSLVDAKVNTEIMPRFIECMALAVDGAIKGVYSDLRQEINASLANDLIGAGLPRERVETAITATLGSGGTTVFASILAKAMDLMRKTPAAYEEAKSMIASTALPQSEMDMEQSRVRATLNASASNNIILGNAAYIDNGPAFNNDVQKMRQKLKFSTKF